MVEVVLVVVVVVGVVVVNVVVEVVVVGVVFGACDFDTNGWWVSGTTIFPSEETLKFHFLGPGGSFFQPFRLFKIYRVH